MKTKLSILFVCAFSLNVFAQSLETIKTYHDWSHTQLKEVYTVIKNTPTKHGKYKLWSQSSILVQEATYSNGKLNGITKRYSVFGKLLQLTNYRNDKKHGLEKNYTFDSNGGGSGDPKKYLGWERYYENDIMVREIEYYESGKKMGDCHPLNGSCIEWYENGLVKFEFFYKNKKLNGKQTEWNEKGQILLKGAWINGENDGTWYSYDDNGKLLDKCSFKNGKIGRAHV